MTQKTHHPVTFSIHLGPGLKVVSSLMTVYAITAGDPVIIHKQQRVNGQKWRLELGDQGYDYFYVIATVERYRHRGKTRRVGDRRITLLGVFGSDEQRVRISEQTTVANAYAFRAMSSFADCGDMVLSAGPLRSRVCYLMRNNFVHTNGRLSKVISRSPNALETNSLALFNSLSSLLYYCIVDQRVYDRLLRYTDTDAACRGTAGAFYNLVRQPFRKAGKIYKLIKHRKPRYLPALTTITPPKGQRRRPNQWTLTVKINDSGAQNFTIAGPAYVVFDKDGKAWLNNNVTQGTPNSNAFCSVFNPDGSPWEGSPITGGGLLGAGFGAAINHRKDTIAIGNFGWGPTQCNPQTGSISLFKSDGSVISPPGGTINGLARVQGLNYDRQGNLWMTSWGSQAPLAPASGTIYEFADQDSAVVVYLDGDPDRAISFSFGAPDHGPFGLAIDSQGNAFVSNKGNGSDIPASVYKFRIEPDRRGNRRIVQKARWQSDYQPPRDRKGKHTGAESFRQVQVNQHDEVFIGGVKSSQITKLDNNLNKLTTFNTHINGPWGITFDTAGTLFVANFLPGNTPYAADPDTSPDPAGPFSVTVIYNEDYANARLMTLPSGGDEVMLANGFPLYGNLYGPSYDPLQRLTSTNIDCAGNLWAVNNWKPSLDNNLTANPGGDGVVIFVGVAEPAAE